jgi:hypothetical protein
MCGFGSERSRPQCKEIRGALVILSGQVLFFYLFHGLIQKKVTTSENEGRRQLQMKITRVKLQSKKNKGKITIALYNRGRNIKFPYNKVQCHRTY